MEESAPLLADPVRRASHASEGESKKIYGSLRRDSEAVLNAEGVGQTEDNTFIWLLLVMSGLMTVVGVIYAIRANSMAVVVEATAEFLDCIAYSLNLYCLHLCRGKPMEFKEKMEKRTAVGSTILLLICGVRIGMQAYSQVMCSGDLDLNPNDPADVPCALIQGRPKPAMVLFTAFLMLLSYVPPLVYFHRKGGSLNSYHPSEDINKASAVLHVAFDVVLQFSVIFASLVMIFNKSTTVEIDAVCSIFVTLMMIFMTGWMWYKYLDKASTASDEIESPSGESPSA